MRSDDLKGRNDVGNSGDYEKPDKKALEEYVQSLAVQVNQLSASVNALSGMNTVGNVLEQGFHRFEEPLRAIAGLPAQLAPLIKLAPDRPDIPEAAGLAINQLLGAMKRPELPGIGSLGIGEANVPFIGQLQGGQVAGLPQPVALPLGALLQRPGQLLQLPGQANQPLAAAPIQQALGGGIKQP